MKYVTSMVIGFDHSNEFDVNYCSDCVKSYKFGNSPDL